MNEMHPLNPKTDKTLHIEFTSNEMYPLLKSMQGCFGNFNIQIPEVSKCSFILCDLSSI